MIKTYRKDILNPDQNHETDGIDFTNAGFERLSNSLREVVIKVKG